MAEWHNVRHLFTWWNWNGIFYGRTFFPILVCFTITLLDIVLFLFFLHILRLFRRIPLCSRQFPYFTKSKSQFSWNFGFLKSLVSFKIIKQINIRLLNTIKRIHQEGEISLDISHRNRGSTKHSSWWRKNDLT